MAWNVLPKRRTRTNRPPSRRKQAGFARLSMLLARWGKKPLTVQQLFASNASAPGLHFETYDPNTILRRRNLFLWSEDFAQSSWTKTNASITANATAAPDGTMTADMVTATGGASSNHDVYQGVTSTFPFRIGEQQTFSIYAKAGTSGFLYISMWGGSGARDCFVNLTTGATTPFNVTAVVTDAGNGWWRIAISAAHVANSVSELYISVCQSMGSRTYVAAGETIYLWGAQFERAASAASAYQKVTDWNTEFLAAGGDRVTMFTDAACSTPVVKVEDSIGGFISSERGTARGANVLANGTFNTNLSGWINSSGAWSWDAGTAKLTGDGSLQELMDVGTLTVGTWYEITLDYVHVSGAGSLGIYMDGGATPVLTMNTSGPKRAVARASSNDLSFKRASGTLTCTIDNVTVRPLPGKIAVQATAGFKPKLDARVNLVTKSEQFDDSAWIKNAGGTGAAPVVTSNAATAPDGTLTADRVVFNIAAGTTTADLSIIQQSITAINGVGTFWIKADAPVRVMSRMNANWTTVDATTAWQKVTMTDASAGSVQIGLRAGYGIASLPANATVYLWGADLRTASDAALDIPAYQRVNTPTDYDSEGFPHRVRGDGADDFLSLPLNMSTTDKVTAWMSGELKKSDAAAAVLMEFTGNSGTTAGGIALFGPDGGANYSGRGNGNPATTAKASTATNFAAPRSDVLTLAADIAADSCILDVNGVQAATSAADQIE